MQKFYDKLLLGAAAIVFVLVAAWIFGGDSGDGFDKLPKAGPGKNYQPIGMDAPDVKTEVWERPRSQKSGNEWVYDLFTPPEIYYDEATKKFTVTPPVEGGARTETEHFPVALVQIKQDVFPLQLVGYDEDKRGVSTGHFENADTGEIFRARLTKAGGVFPNSAKRHLAALGYKLESFEVKRLNIESEGSMTLRDTVATATVVDEKTGASATLTNKRRLVRGMPFAVLRIVGSGETLELRAGAEFEAGGFRYTLLSVETDSVEIEQKSANTEAPETRKTLTPDTGTASIVEPAEPPNTPEP